MIGMLTEQTRRLIRKFMAKFVKPVVVQKAVSVKDVAYQQEENQLDDDTIVLGLSTRTYLKEVEDDISLSARSRFFR